MSTKYNIYEVPNSYIIERLTQTQRERIALHYNMKCMWLNRPISVSKSNWIEQIADKFCVSVPSVEKVIYNLK